MDLTYDYHHVGGDRQALVDLAEADHAGAKDKRSVVIVGMGALREADGAAVLSQAMKLAEGSNSKLMVLHTAAGRVGALDAGVVTQGGITAAWTGPRSSITWGGPTRSRSAGCFRDLPGSHGDRGAHRADVILPGAAYTEEGGLFVNTEGRPQLAQRAAFPPGEAKENWAILRALSAELDATQPWDNQAGLRRALVEAVPHLGKLDQIAENTWTREPLEKPAKATFVNAIKDFYLTNPIARASEVMAELSANAKARADTKVAAE